MNDTLRNELRIDAVKAAKRLLGCLLIVDIDDAQLRFMIVETEAYNQTDPASHSYKGLTNRNEVMFGPPGYLYVYFSYGMHYCCNVVVGEGGYGSAVLIRAVEPLDYLEILSDRRGGRSGVELTNGPAKVCQALGITKKLNGHDLSRQPVRLSLEERLTEEEIISTTRIGIRYAADKMWRYYIKKNPYVSKKDNLVSVNVSTRG